MPNPTAADKKFAARVAKRFPGFTARMAQTLRERKVLTEGEPGRGKTTPYSEQDYEVACAVEDAKADPSYKNKLHRAIVVAWVRGAPVRTAGLRRALKEHLATEGERLATELNGGRVRRDPRWEGGGVIDLAPRDRKAMGELFGWMLLGHKPPDSMVVQGLSPALPALAEVLRGVADEIEAATPPDDADTQTALEEIRDSRFADDHLGMLETSARARSPRPTAFARTMVETLNLSAGEWVVKRAARQQLDEARDACVALREKRPEFADMHDLDIALAALGLLLGDGHIPLPDERIRKD